ncbi:MAG: hypothetical protein IKK33_11095 [Lachnospiraceae bacterium]|nr:hypothetical protein [Lachnospiraceae bacterium]
MAEKKTWKNRLATFVPRYIPNLLVAGVIGFMQMVQRTSKEKVEQNFIENSKLLEEQAVLQGGVPFFCPGTYIENQRLWRKVSFGRDYTMSYGGCEIIAVYNALLSLGKELSSGELAELISHFERRGAVRGGLWGVAPQAVKPYFKRKGYHVKKTWSRKEKSISRIGEESDTVIVFSYNNGQDIFDGMHTVNISKDEEGKFHVHNDYRTGPDDQGRIVFVSHGPYDTLAEAVSNLSEGTAASICVIGIRKKV